MKCIDRVKLKALACLVALALAAVATVAWMGLPWIPVVGVAVAAAVVSVGRFGDRFSRPICFDCGCDLTGEPLSDFGIACPSCGSVHQPRPSGLASGGFGRGEPRA